MLWTESDGDWVGENRRRAAFVLTHLSRGSLPFSFSGFRVQDVHAIVRPCGRNRNKALQIRMLRVGHWSPVVFRGFVRGHPGFGRAHKVPCQEEPLLVSAADGCQLPMVSVVCF